MAEELYRLPLGRGSRFTIRIGKKTLAAGLNPFEQGSSSSAPKSGLMPTTNIPDDYIPAAPPKTGLIVNFYHLGEQLIDDVWISDDRRIVPTIEEINDWDSSGGVQYGSFKTIHHDEILGKYNGPLAVPAEDWKTKFRKLDYEEAIKYYLNLDSTPDTGDFISADNPHWTEQGLKVESLDFLSVYQGLDYISSPRREVFYSRHPIFQPIVTLDNPDFKVTATPDYEAEALTEIEWTKEPVSVFLNPQMWMSDATVRIDSVTQLILNVIAFAMTKDLSVDSPFAEVHEWSEDDFYYNSNTLPNILRGDFVRVMSNVDWARQLSKDVADVFTDGGPVDVQFTSGYPEDTGTPQGYGEYFVNTFATPIGIEGVLVGVVNQGDNWYYYWSAT